MKKQPINGTGQEGPSNGPIDGLANPNQSFQYPTLTKKQTTGQEGPSNGPIDGLANPNQSFEYPTLTKKPEGTSNGLNPNQSSVNPTLTNNPTPTTNQTINPDSSVVNGKNYIANGDSLGSTANPEPDNTNPNNPSATLPTDESGYGERLQNAQDLTDDLSVAEQGLYNKRRDDTIKNKDSDIDRANQDAKDNEDLIKEYDDYYARIEAEQKRLLEISSQSEIANLEAQRALERANADRERARLDLEASKLKKQNELAIIQAQQGVYLAQQQSAWAYQKLGLGFSSGIINQSQSISTNGYIEIAKIKAELNYKQALYGLDTADIEAKFMATDLEYTNSINKVINETTEKKLALDTDIVNRLKETQQNLLLNNQAKQEKIDNILDTYRKDLINLEDTHLSNIQKLSDRGLELAKEYKSYLDGIKAENLTTAETLISTGLIANYTQDQIADLEGRAGLPTGTLMSQYNSTISSTLNSTFQDVLDRSDFLLSGDTLQKYSNEVKGLISTGKSLQEAISIIVSKYYKSYPNKTQIDLEAYKAKASSSGSSSSSAAGTYSNVYDNKTGELYRINSKTNQIESTRMFNPNAKPFVAPISPANMNTAAGIAAREKYIEEAYKQYIKDNTITFGKSTASSTSDNNSELDLAIIDF